ncbi:MAG: Uncharacterized protein G01um101416_655 [Microgenomates group bacterium Gr01-1014_16]|nr:MAG: Uncharacterized protein G01um101416_655 [Microgenomates group bacterium Gr01-1014_16]
MFNKLLKIFLILDLVVVNGGVGYLLYRNFQFSIFNFQSNSNVPISNFQTKTEYVDRCGEECLAAIKAEMSNVQYPISNPTPTIAKLKQPVKTRKEEVLTIPGEGSGNTMDWTDITATNFYFDTKDYPGIVEVYFEAKIKLLNGNGYGYVRLYDVTNGIAINGSENNTNNQVETWTKSQKVYFWAGKNLIRVQAKSLTADTVVYTQGRLRIVTEN